MRASVASVYRGWRLAIALADIFGSSEGGAPPASFGRIIFPLPSSESVQESLSATTTMAQLSFSSRHPRTTIFAALLGLVSLLFLANSYNSPQAGHHYIRSVEDLGYLNAPRGYLASFLAAAEAQYQEAIFMRGEYIRRWEGLDGLVL